MQVKSLEDGFLGSWHLGTVISCSDLIREVQYDFIWSDQGSDKLVEVVNVSPIIEGLLPVDERPAHQCGMIRPSPPPCELDSWPYGQCVDCFYQDAWWEGVLFDREEGHEERKVFFPELGDEMKAKLGDLRISQDWDEITEEWKIRGSWSFLQVVEEIEKLNPLLVSVKQIWYEVQLKDDFDEHLKQWTSSSKDIWRKLVKEVVHDSTKLTVKHYLSELNSLQIIGEGCQLLEFSESAFIAELNPEVYFAPFTEAAYTLDSSATLPMDQDLSNLQPVEKQLVSEESAPAAEDVQMTGILSSTESELPTLAKAKRGRGRPRKVKKIFKGRTQVTEPDSCREANSTKAIKEKIFDDVSPLQQPVDQDVPNLHQPLDQDISDLQPLEKQLVPEESAPATEDDLLSGILSNTKSQPLTIANSKACRGRSRTKRKIYDRQTVVGEPASCREANLTKTIKEKIFEDDSPLQQPMDQDVPNLQQPLDQDISDLQPLEKQLVSEESAPAAEDVQVTGILSSTESELPTLAKAKRGRGRPRKVKKIFKGRTRVGEPDSCREANSTKTIKEKIFKDVSPLQQPVNQDAPNLQQPLDQDISDLQPLEKQLVSEESAPAAEDDLLSGILSNTKSRPLTIANSKACRGRSRTKRKIYDRQTVVGEPAFCREANLTKTIKKKIFEDVSPLQQPMDQDVPNLQQPLDQDISNLQPLEEQLVSEESAPAAEDVQMTGILSSTESELPTLAKAKRGRGRPRKVKKIFKGRTRVGEPDSCREANSTKTIKEKIFEDVSPLQQPLDQDVPNLQQPLDQDISDLQPSEKQLVSEESAPAAEDDLLSGILSNTKSRPLTIVNSKACRGRPRTKRNIYDEQTVVGEPASCLDTTSTETFNKLPSDETAGILSSTTQTLENSKPRRGRPPKRMKTLGKPDSCPEATLIKELKKPTSHQIAGILSNGKCVNSKSRRGRLAIKKKFVRQLLFGEPDPHLKVITKCMPSMSSIQEFKDHLLWTGWKFDVNKVGGETKNSYVAPNGTVCASINEICQVLEASKICEVVPPVEQSSLHGDTDNSTQSPCMERPTCREVPELHKETLAATTEISIQPARTSIQRGDTDNSTQSPCMERPTCREVPELHKETPAETEEISIQPARTSIQRGDTDNSTQSPCMERPTCREVPELHKETPAETEERSIQPARTGTQRGDTDNSTQSPCMERPTSREVPELHKETISETEERGIQLEKELEEAEIPQQETGNHNEEINTEPEEPMIEPEICRQAVIDYCLPKSHTSAYQKSYRNGVKIRDTALKAKTYLVANGWKLIPLGNNDQRIRYLPPEGEKPFLSFRGACNWCVQKWKAESHLPSSQSAVVDKPLISILRESRKKRKHADVKSKSSLKKGDGDMRSSKRARKVAPSSSNQIPRTVLSWLIDKNVVLPRAKVKYCELKNGNPMAQGRITREGIKCNCCQKIFGLRNFEAHAGSICNRPSANIYLEDGRSLLECQMQMKRKHSTENKESSHFTENDYICSVCHYGGDLILCDGCPSSFHPDCLGIKEVPNGDWFCPSCCCKVCGESRFDKDRKQFTDNTLLICCQCNHKYHARCVRNNGLEKLDDFPVGNWLCNKSCKLICLGMRQLLKKSVIVGNDDLTWRLLKYTEPDDESSVEIYSRLCVALNMMHDSFEPVKERLTGRDIAEDVIFSRWSELNRLNFQGFYTVLLERNDELISVGTVRVYGEKVAEIPLVATQFKHRRLGMCRILFNELEKTLAGLGVQRLVLPAVPGVLNTWTKKFGFSVVGQSERANFFDYTFLDFQGTIMCQKVLERTPAEDNVVVSEVFQATQVEGCATVDQG
ncbi:uncharacterized protein [Solanum lycopersicum]|uniref:uncharacterized protein n=1 Tax=Solanum lycopersicum TaxID=4081 RepID=UPI0037493735